MDIEHLLSSSCPGCGVVAICNPVFDFCECPVCQRVWSDGENDPDYDDDIPQAQEAIAEMNIKRINQWNPNN